MTKKSILSTVFVVALLAVTAGQAMAKSNSEATSGSVDLTNAHVTNASVTPFSVDTGGGVWDYGTSVTLSLRKKVWSNYTHPTKTHHSSCSIGTSSNHSGNTKAGTTSYSSAIGGLDDETHAYWGAES